MYCHAEWSFVQKPIIKQESNCEVMKSTEVMPKVSFAD